MSNINRDSSVRAVLAATVEMLTSPEFGTTWVEEIAESESLITTRSSYRSFTSLEDSKTVEFLHSSILTAMGKVAEVISSSPEILALIETVVDNELASLNKE